MGKRIALAGIVALGALLSGTVAEGAMVKYGTLVLRADGGFTPRVLPKHAFAPIDFKGYSDIETTDGSAPPALQHVKLEFDRDGRLTTAGLGVCPPSRIEAAAPKQARRLCRGAIVGTGRVGAAVSVPLKRIELRSALTLFNGPRQNGHPTVVAHAQVGFPVFETYVVVAPIERRGGIYRYRTSFDIPPIAGGFGALTHVDAKIGRHYRLRGGVERSYVSARCSDFILQTQGYFSFADGTVIYGSVFKACQVAG